MKSSERGPTWARPRPLQGKFGIVTGAGTGIGQTIAATLASLGANVGINYWHSQTGAVETAKRVRAEGSDSLLLPGDVADEAVVRDMVHEAESKFGSIDFLVNNAGAGGGADTDDAIYRASYADWNRLLASNLSSAFLMTRYAAPGMIRKRSGRIVNISSLCGLTGDCGPAYCAAKAGMLGLTRHSAVALAPHVQVNAILPGFVSSLPHDPEKVARITPGRRIGHPSDIADLAGYLLASPQGFLTGACIVMDGSVSNGVIGRMMDWAELAGPDPD